MGTATCRERPGLLHLRTLAQTHCQREGKRDFFKRDCGVLASEAQFKPGECVPRELGDQLTGKHLLRDFEVAVLSAEQGQERLRNAVAGDSEANL